MDLKLITFGRLIRTKAKLFPTGYQNMEKLRVLTISNTEKIIRRLKKDNKSAFDELFGYFYPRLYHFSKSILKIENETMIF